MQKKKVIILAILILFAIYIVKNLSQKITEESLTTRYGTNVSELIKNFENRWMSIELYKNPNLLDLIATQPFLDDFGFSQSTNMVMNEPFWLVTTSVKIIKVKVFEYYSTKIVAAALIEIYSNKTKTNGEFLETMPVYPRCRLYSFQNNDNTWKLSSSFDASNANEADRDWRDFSERSKEPFKSLPNGIIFNCNNYMK